MAIAMLPIVFPFMTLLICPYMENNLDTSVSGIYYPKMFSTDEDGENI